MQLTIIILLILHVIPGVYWAGATFTVAREGSAGSAGLFRSQMAAATLAVLAGVGLMAVVHPAGKLGMLLNIGAACSIAAAGAQGALRRKAPVQGQRIAALLLAITVICMVIARYV